MALHESPVSNLGQAELETIVNASNPEQWPVVHGSWNRRVKIIPGHEDVLLRTDPLEEFVLAKAPNHGSDCSLVVDNPENALDIYQKHLDAIVAAGEGTIGVVPFKNFVFENPHRADRALSLYQISERLTSFRQSHQLEELEIIYYGLKIADGLGRIIEAGPPYPFDLDNIGQYARHRGQLKLLDTDPYLTHSAMRAVGGFAAFRSRVSSTKGQKEIKDLLELAQTKDEQMHIDESSGWFDRYII